MLKKDYFSIPETEEIISRINNKRGDFYQDEGIWQSICRVERGKVSNKMRFAIYNRDNYCCRKCGRHNCDLEIDHIYPISKGEKTTPDNLQTLCHECNTKKSNNIEKGVISPRYGRKISGGICPNCNVNLVLRKSRYGEFWGCPNYPNCKFTKK